MVTSLNITLVHCYHGNLFQQSEVSQTPGYRGRGPWTPVNTLPYQMCRPAEWRDSGMFSTPHTLLPPPLPSRAGTVFCASAIRTTYISDAFCATYDQDGDLIFCRFEIYAKNT